MQVNSEGTKIINLFTGDKIQFGDLELKVLWPERKWVEERLGKCDEGCVKSSIEVGSENILPGSDPVLGSDPNGTVLGSDPNGGVLGAETLFPLNSFGIVFLINYPCPQCPSPALPSKAWRAGNPKPQNILLMADADSLVQDKILAVNPNLGKVDILKFPHHGSKTGMTEEYLAKIKPSTAIISVGKNSFGHPTQEALDLLSKYKVEVKRTDQLGDIIIQLTN